MANYTEGQENRNDDQGTFWNITDTLDINWRRIWNTTDQDLHPDVTESSWRSDILGLFRDMQQVLSCRVVSILPVQSYNF